MTENMSAKKLDSKKKEQIPKSIFYTLVMLIALFFATDLSGTWPILPWIVIGIAIFIFAAIMIFGNRQLWPIGFALAVAILLTIDHFKATDSTIPLNTIDVSVITLSGIIFGFGQIKRQMYKSLLNLMLFSAIFLSFTSIAGIYTNNPTVVIACTYACTAAVFFSFVAIWFILKGDAGIK